MSLVVGMIRDKVVHMASDSYIGLGGVKGDTGVKLVKKGAYIFGTVGYSRMCDIIESVFTPPPVPKIKPTKKFMSTSFIRKLRSCLEAEAYLVEEDGVKSFNSNIMVGVKGKLFIVCRDFSVVEPLLEVDEQGFMAIGAGSAFAYGAWHACGIHDLEYDTYDILEVTLEAAAAYSKYVLPPYIHIEL